MTPLELQFLLDANLIPIGVKTKSEPESDFANRGVDAGVFEINDVGTSMLYRTTDLGEAWLNACLTVRVPEVRYIDERGHVVLHREGGAM